MQIEELPAQALKRSFKIVVEATEIEGNISSRLAEIGKTAKLDGFRPGKVPLPVLQKRYGEAVRGEAVENAAKAAVDKALKERNLRPAMAPQIELGELKPGAPLAFTVNFEVLPEVTPGDFSQIKLDKPVVTAADSAVDGMIERMAKRNREAQPISENRPAQNGDVLLIDFDGSTEGKAHPGMKGEDHKLELGSKSFIDGFEEQLIGKAKGDDVLVKVTFPEAYHAAELAGKPAEFKVAIKDILAHAPLVLDDALAGEMGFDTIAELRTRVKDSLQAQHDQITKEVMRRQLLDQLSDAYDFDVPHSMVDAEFNSIWQQVQQEKARGNTVDEDEGKDEATQQAEYRDIAERRVRLGLLLAEVGRAQQIKVEPAELRDAVIAETRRYPGQEKQVFDYFTKTPGAMDQLRAPILEQKVVDYVISLATISERTVSEEELRAMPDKLDEAAEAKAKQRAAAPKKAALKKSA